MTKRTVSRWRCLICGATGITLPRIATATLHAHYLDHHYQPPQGHPTERTATP